jgi:hypothetical protein
VVEHVPEHQNQHDHGDDAIGEDGVADADIVAEPLQERRLRLDVLRAYGFIGRIQEIGGQNDLPGAQRDNEGRQLDPRNQPAI